MEEEQRVLGGLRCSRSERWPPGCLAAVLLSSEADSDAAGWTSESPDLDNAVGELTRGSQPTMTQRHRFSVKGALHKTVVELKVSKQRVSHLFEAAKSVQRPLPLLTHSGISFGFIIFLSFSSLHRKQQSRSDVLV